jgi:hypothetical protein
LVWPGFAHCTEINNLPYMLAEAARLGGHRPSIGKSAVLRAGAESVPFAILPCPTDVE